MVKIPVSVTSNISNFHFAFPVIGSIACTMPRPASEVQLLIGPRRSSEDQGTGNVARWLARRRNERLIAAAGEITSGFILDRRAAEDVRVSVHVDTYISGSRTVDGEYQFEPPWMPG